MLSRHLEKRLRLLSLLPTEMFVVARDKAFPKLCSFLTIEQETWAKPRLPRLPVFLTTTAFCLTAFGEKL